jgi:hypothetical protein
MSHIWTFLFIVCMSIVAHAAGFASREDAAWVMVISLVALAVHWLVMKIDALSELDEPPFPNLHSEFVRAYFEACNSSQPADWQGAAVAAKRWENALIKPARHTLLRGVKRRPA